MKSMTKQMITVLMVLLIAGAIVVALVVMHRNNTPPVSDETTQNNESGSQSEPDFSVLTSINSQGVLDFLSELKSGFLYAGRPTCPHCQAFAPILIEVVREQNLTVYYYNTDATRGEAQRSEVLEALNITGVPTFMYIQNGQIAGVLVNTTSREALIDFISQQQR